MASSNWLHRIPREDRQQAHDEGKAVVLLGVLYRNGVRCEYVCRLPDEDAEAVARLLSKKMDDASRTVGKRE